MKTIPAQVTPSGHYIPVEHRAPQTKGEAYQLIEELFACMSEPIPMQTMKALKQISQLFNYKPSAWKLPTKNVHEFMAAVDYLQR